MSTHVCEEGVKCLPQQLPAGSSSSSLLQACLSCDPHRSLCCLLQIELSSSSGAGMMASWAHRSHIVVHQLVPHNSLKQHMQYSSQQQAAGNKVTRVYYKVLQQHAAFAWLQVRDSRQGSGAGQGSAAAVCTAAHPRQGQEGSSRPRPL
jgi:hypothetical protein